MLRVGLDLDNTIISYDQVFVAAAKRIGLAGLPVMAGKAQVRAALRARPDGEMDWQRLQGWVYGAGIGEASLFDGVTAFLAACDAAGAEVFIVSHKTEFGHFDPERVNLRQAALGWLEAQGLVGEGAGRIPRSRVLFGATRTEKVGHLAGLGCDHFVDDLEEVFLEPAFPATTRRHLFAPGREVETGPYLVHKSWYDVRDTIFP